MFHPNESNSKQVEKEKVGRYDEVWLLMSTCNALEDCVYEGNSLQHLDSSITNSLRSMNIYDQSSRGLCPDFKSSRTQATLR